MNDDHMTVYVPTRDEPSVFSEVYNGVPVEWPCWYRHKQETGRGKIMHYQLFIPSQDLLQRAEALRVRLRQELHTQDVQLPPVPPPMFALGTQYISLAWILDICRRDKMHPEEAHTLAKALLRM